MALNRRRPTFIDYLITAFSLFLLSSVSAGALAVKTLNLPGIPHYSLLPPPDVMPDIQGHSISLPPTQPNPEQKFQVTGSIKTPLGRDSRTIIAGLLLVVSFALVIIETANLIFSSNRSKAVILVIVLIVLAGAGITILYNLDYLLPLLPAKNARDALEVTYFVAQTAIAVVVLAAAVYAREQVAEGRNARFAALKQSRATFLLELDRRWDSPEISKSIRLFRTLRDEELGKIFKSDPHADVDLALQKVKAEFPNKLQQLRDNEKTKSLYDDLMVFPGLLETIGVMAKQDYINLDDITNLFEWSIIDFYHYFRAHIQKRQTEPGVPQRFLQNALNLAEQVEQRVSRINALVT
jgi:hypothetical protein